MKLRVGYQLVYQCDAATPMLLMLHTHPVHAMDLLTPDTLVCDPPVAVTHYQDGFGNRCSRIVAPPGPIAISNSVLLNVADEPESNGPHEKHHPVQELPNECLVYLLGSRYCETDLLSDISWNLFGHMPPGRARVQAICDFVHQHVAFDYRYARPTKTAMETWNERAGVCRDLTHLAITMCRAINIPARYCTGYISDVGVSPLYPPMDFNAWFEAYVGGSWQTFDPRYNTPRVGRVLMARGRDAADVGLSNAFGVATLIGFEVHCAPEVE